MPDLLLSFRFLITLVRSAEAEPGDTRVPVVARSGTRLCAGAFQECSGLELETDVREYLEGGRNDGVIRRVGRVKLQPLVLKRGMFAPPPESRGEGATPAEGTSGYVSTELWAWLQGVVGDVRPVQRYDGTIDVQQPKNEGEVMARWTFRRGLPMKVVGPALNARTGEVAIEEMHVAHEGLRLESSR